MLYDIGSAIYFVIVYKIGIFVTFNTIACVQG